MATSTLTREAPQERTNQLRAAQHKSLWPVLFWAGVAVGQFGAIHPGWSYPWQASAFAGAALLVTLGLITVHAAEGWLSEDAWRRLRLTAYLSGFLMVAHQLTTSAYVTGLSRTGSFLLYGSALIVAVWTRTTRSNARTRYGTLLIASGTGVGRMRATLRDAERPVVVYRARDEYEAACAEELRDLAEHLIVVEGAEHDPRAKELMSASGLSRLVPDVADREVYVTGPRDFARYVRGALARLEVPARTPRPPLFKARQRA